MAAKGRASGSTCINCLASGCVHSSSSSHNIPLFASQRNPLATPSLAFTLILVKHSPFHSAICLIPAQTHCSVLEYVFLIHLCSTLAQHAHDLQNLCHLFAVRFKVAVTTLVVSFSNHPQALVAPTGMSTRSRQAYQAQELLALRDSVSENAVTLENFTDDETVKGKFSGASTTQTLLKHSGSQPPASHSTHTQLKGPQH